jgi:hypothetical protein
MLVVTTVGVVRMLLPTVVDGRLDRDVNSVGIRPSACDMLAPSLHIASFLLLLLVHYAFILVVLSLNSLAACDLGGGDCSIQLFGA